MDQEQKKEQNEIIMDAQQAEEPNKPTPNGELEQAQGGDSIDNSIFNKPPRRCKNCNRVFVDLHRTVMTCPRCGGDLYLIWL